MRFWIFVSSFDADISRGLFIAENFEEMKNNNAVYKRGRQRSAYFIFMREGLDELDQSLEQLYAEKQLSVLLRKLATLLEKKNDTGYKVLAPLAALYETNAELIVGGSMEISKCELIFKGSPQKTSSSEKLEFSERPTTTTPTKPKTPSSTMPYPAIVENDVLARTKKFFPNETVVKPKKIGNLVGDVLVKDRFIIEVKSGKTNEKQLAKILEYAKIYKVSGKVLVAGPFTPVTRSLEKYARQNGIHILYQTSLEDGLGKLDSWDENDPLIIQDPPKTHISISGADYRILAQVDKQLFSDTAPDSLNSKPAQRGLWSYAYDISTIWYDEMSKGNPKSAIKAVTRYLKEDQKIEKPPAEATIENFAAFLISYVSNQFSEE